MKGCARELDENESHYRPLAHDKANDYCDKMLDNRAPPMREYLH